ncbi:CU044_5270 family protein [Kitasatospora sp. NPDC051853]|uniref:CU044_5270 family protein n=1 Tax=Kitasatospora sp. NPDC051853 TaxID=3364058 RepID=UPI0037A86138
MNREHEPVLPADRHQLLRGHLMSEIDQENAPRRSPARRYGWVALPALAGGLALVMVLGGGGSGEVPERPPVAAGPLGTPSASAQPVPEPVQLLDRIAQVAAAKPAQEVKDHQFVYVKSVNRFPDYWKNVMVPGTLREREAWHSVDGKKAGLLYEPGLFRPGVDPGVKPDGTMELDTNTSPNVNSPTYRYLAALPTDPKVLLQKMIDEKSGKEHTPQSAFGVIGDLLREQIAPPEVTAALYRAAGLIEGVQLIDDVADARGRHGVAVGLTVQDVRLEWVFDRGTSEFLGERQVVVKEGSRGKPGDVIAETAVLTRAVVDKAGDRP